LQILIDFNRTGICHETTAAVDRLGPFFDQAPSQSICFFERNNNTDLLDLWIGATDLRR
jgi:hypothetical protein